MHFMGVNLWAVLASAVATMVAGFLWYSPALFAKPWTILMGYDPNDKAKMAEMQKSAGPSYGMSFVASILAAFVLGKILQVSTAREEPARVIMSVAKHRQSSPEVRVFNPSERRHA